MERDATARNTRAYVPPHLRKAMLLNARGSTAKPEEVQRRDQVASLWVGNLPLRSNEALLRQEFARFGTIISVVPIDFYDIMTRDLSNKVDDCVDDVDEGEEDVTVDEDDKPGNQSKRDTSATSRREVWTGTVFVNFDSVESMREANTKMNGYRSELLGTTLMTYARSQAPIEGTVTKYRRSLVPPPDDDDINSVTEQQSQAVGQQWSFRMLDSALTILLKVSLDEVTYLFRFQLDLIQQLRQVADITLPGTTRGNHGRTTVWERNKKSPPGLKRSISIRGTPSVVESVARELATLACSAHACRAVIQLPSVVGALSGVLSAKRNEVKRQNKRVLLEFWTWGSRDVTKPVELHLKAWGEPRVEVERVLQEMIDICNNNSEDGYDDDYYNGH